MRSWAAAGITIGYLILGYACALLYAVDCSELPDADLGSGCDAVGDSWTPLWWVAALWPAAVFVTSRFIPRLRDHGYVVLLVIGVLMVALWAPLFMANP